MVNDLELLDITHSTMRVRWKTAAGASGYMILYAPLTEEESGDEKEVRRLVVCGFMLNVSYEDGNAVNKIYFNFSRSSETL